MNLVKKISKIFYSQFHWKKQFEIFSENSIKHVFATKKPVTSRGQNPSESIFEISPPPICNK